LDVELHTQPIRRLTVGVCLFTPVSPLTNPISLFPLVIPVFICIFLTESLHCHFLPDALLESGLLLCKPLFIHLMETRLPPQLPELTPCHLSMVYFSLTPANCTGFSSKPKVFHATREVVCLRNPFQFPLSYGRDNEPSLR